MSIGNNSIFDRIFKMADHPFTHPQRAINQSTSSSKARPRRRWKASHRTYEKPRPEFEDETSDLEFEGEYGPIVEDGYAPRFQGERHTPGLGEEHDLEFEHEDGAMFEGEHFPMPQLEGEEAPRFDPRRQGEEEWALDYEAEEAPSHVWTDPVSGDAGADDGPDLPFSTVKQHLWRYFRERNAQALMPLLRRISNNAELRSQIPATTISELFELVHPDLALGEAKKIHHGLSDESVAKMGLQSIAELFASHHKVTADVGTIRRKIGSPLTVSDYTFFLNCAKAFGDPVGADAVWAELRRDRRRPDTTCFNLFLEAKAWGTLFFPRQRFSVRVQTYWSSVAVRERERMGASELRKKAIKAFNEMVEEGVAADAKTFSLLIIALAREQDMAGVHWALQTGWNIHVDDVLGRSGNSPPPVTRYPKDSPLYPGIELLFAVAHAFCINNEVPSALMIVDYISRQYDIPTSVDLWTELLERTYVATVVHRNTNFSFHADVGRLPLEAVMNLFEIVTGVTYKVQPTTRMYRHAIASLLQRQTCQSIVDRTREGLATYRRSMRAFQLAQRKLQLLEALDARGIRFHVAELSPETARRELELARLARARDRKMVSIWAGWILRTPSFFDGIATRWERHGLPKAVAEFRRYMPSGIYYRSTGGYVTLFDRRDYDYSDEAQEYDLVTGEELSEFRSIYA